MPVLINFKICDNSEDCDGIEACSTGAIYWDRENRTLAIDNSKCTNCALCENSCPVGAIKFAKNKEEYDKIKKEIDEDPRKVSDLFVDRYGAQPIHRGFIIAEDKFDIQIINSTKLAVVELFNEDSIMCLRYSIPAKLLFKDMDIKYRKVQLKDDELLKKYNVKKLPSLLFFKEGKLMGKIEGYYSIKGKEKIMEKINQIIK